MFKRMTKCLENIFENIIVFISKKCLFITHCFMNNRGDREDGLYSDKDSQDETELTNILNDNIIHPYKEDNAVIFHQNGDAYNYNCLPNFSPVESDDEEDDDDFNFKKSNGVIDNLLDIENGNDNDECEDDEEDLIDLSDIEANIGDEVSEDLNDDNSEEFNEDFTDAKES